MCSLNNEVVPGGIFEVYINYKSIDIIIRGDSFSTNQISACSGSCNSDGKVQVSCSDNGKNYTGTCTKVCCLSCGSTCTLTSCCGG
jgi:hypothetical protein